MPSAVPPPLPANARRGSVAATLRDLPEGARPSELWRSAAFVLLRLNPKECEALALVFEEEAATDELRGHILDVLAGAGTFEAQVVIRRLLAHAVARRSNRTFAMFVQRLGCLELPDGPTLRFLMSVYAESRAEPQDVRGACAYALGAAAGRAFASGETDAATRASDVLRRDLAAAATNADKCSLLTALGNAGVPGDVAVLIRFTQDPKGPVRSASALALRKMNVAEARNRLIILLADRELMVAQSALVALADLKLEDEELSLLAELVLAGRTSLTLDARLLRLLVAQRPRLTSCPGRAGAIENALRLLLGRVEAAGANELSSSGERRAVVVATALAPMDKSGSVHPMPAATVLDHPLQARMAEAEAEQPTARPRSDSGYRIVNKGDTATRIGRG